MSHRSREHKIQRPAPRQCVSSESGWGARLVSLAGSWPWFLVLLFVTFSAYWPALRGDFIWDDDDYVEENEALRTWEGLGRIWSDPTATPQYYPLVHSTFWLEFQFAGLTPAVYHVTNVLLHAINAWLLAKLLRRLGIPGALLASVVFALHPVGVESVAWITERKNVLSMMFYLLCFLFYWPVVEADRQGRTTDDRSMRPTRYYALALTFYVAALLSKTVACSFPAACLLLIYWKFGRITFRDLQRLLPFFAIGIILALNTAHLERSHVGAMGPEFAIPFESRLIVAGRAVWFYLGKLVWPWPLAFSYERWNVEQPAASDFLYPLSAAAFLAILWQLRTRWGRGPLVAALFFGGTLLPALGFINVYPFRYSFVADHFQYLAMLAPIVLFAAAVSAAWDRRGENSPRSLVSGTAMVCGLGLILGSLTWLQSHDYRDLRTLWTNTLAKSPKAALAWYNLAMLNLEEGLPPCESVTMLGRAIELYPHAPEGHAFYGTVLLELQRFDEARVHFLEAIKLSLQGTRPALVMETAEFGLARLHVRNGGSPAAIECLDALAIDESSSRNAAYASTVLERWFERAEHTSRASWHRSNLDALLSDDWSGWMGHATAYEDLGEYSLAADAFLQAAKTKRDDPKPALRAIIMLIQSQRLDEAKIVARNVLAKHPALSQVYANLGVVLAMQGDFSQAAAAFRHSLDLFPNAAEVRANLAMALFQAKRSSEAISELRKANRQEPGNEAVARQYAWVLATHSVPTIRSPAEAVKIASQFLTIAEADPRWFDVLAAAQAAAGEFEAAVRTAEQGQAVAESVGATGLSQAIRERRAIYAERRCFVDPAL